MELQSILSKLQYTLANINFLSTLKFTLLLAIALLVLGLILRIFSGKRSNLRKAIDVAIAIIIIYGIHFILQTTSGQLQSYLPPLPFIQLLDETVTFFVLQRAVFNDICTELVNMLILAFLVGLVNDWIPSGKNFFAWFLLRCLAILCSMALHWGISLLLFRYFPGFVNLYAPTVLMVVLGILLAVTLFKLIIGTLLGVTVSPIIGAIYTFFISNIIGKQIIRASLTSTLLTLAVYALNHYGIAALTLNEALLTLFFPIGLLLFLVWYLLQKLL